MIKYIINLRRIPIIGCLCRIILAIVGLDIPKDVKIGKDVSFVHNAVGTVIHPNTIIKDNVKIYQGVTLGRADIYQDYKKSKMKGFLIEDGAILCAGAKIICKEGTLIVGRNTIIGANTVLLESTGENEIWAGNPAKKIGIRKDIVAQ